MSPQEVKQVLLLYRPGTADAEDPQIIEAIEAARGNPELARWFKEHCAFQEAMRAKLRAVEVPPHLKAALLARQKAIVPPHAWWQRPVWLAPVAAAVCIGLASLWIRGPSAERFTNFQARMVGAALREYRMDVITSDMGQVRRFLAERGAPGDYVVPEGLKKLQLTGAGFLRWRNHPVSMVCFNRGDDQMLFLFVMKRSAVKDPPPARPQLGKMNEMATASWSRGGEIYMLAGPDETDFRGKHL